MPDSATSVSGYLLSLAILHTAAPGVLDVVFGLDGDFEGAPNFTGPVWTGSRYVPAQAHNGRIGTLKGSEIRNAALDPRIPSVAARLAGLCARALGATGEGVRIVEEVTGHEWCLWSGLSEIGWWFSDGTPAIASHPTTAPFHDNTSFLAALTLALAPRIAALRQQR